MTTSEAIKKFIKLYWDDLDPEQINYLGQTEHEVTQLEAENGKIKSDLKLSDDSRMFWMGECGEKNTENAALKRELTNTTEKCFAWNIKYSNAVAENAALKRENEWLQAIIEKQDYFIADQNELRNKIVFRMTEIQRHSGLGLDALLTEQESE